MDTEKLFKRIEMREDWLNGERVSDQYRLGYSEALEFVKDWICEFERVEEQEAEEEARREFIREQLNQEEFE